jgi:hypothetical protein
MLSAGELGIHGPLILGVRLANNDMTQSIIAVIKFG